MDVFEQCRIFFVVHLVRSSDVGDQQVGTDLQRVRTTAAQSPAKSCKDGRDHSCQICLGRHPNAQCPRANKGSGKNKDSGGKSKWKK